MFPIDPGAKTVTLASMRVTLSGDGVNVYSVLAILKLLQSFLKTLHSDGSPHQLAMGVVLGAALGLTPLLNISNLVVLALLILLNVSFGAGMVALVVFTPVGFLLDPLFDRLGHLLLTGTPALTGFWTALYNTPGIPYTNFNNTVVLGSLVAWLLLALPLYFSARAGVVKYRATLGKRVRASRFYKAVTASRAYNVYRWFRPQ